MPGTGMMGNASSPPSSSRPGERRLGGRDADSTDIGIDGLHRGRSIAATTHKPPVDPAFLGGPGADDPILHRAVPLLERPVEQAGIERDELIGVSRMDLEMDDS